MQCMLVLTGEKTGFAKTYGDDNVNASVKIQACFKLRSFAPELHTIDTELLLIRSRILMTNTFKVPR